MVLEAGAADTQRVEVLVNGDSVATTRLEGAEPKRLAFPVAVQTLRAWSLNTVTIRIAGARIGEDSPPLGIALVRLHVQPRPLGRAGRSLDAGTISPHSPTFD